MKTISTLGWVAMSASFVHTNAIGQGSVRFNNCLDAFAPVYGVDPADSGTRHAGNALTNGGTVNYSGHPLLLGTGYTAALWAAPEGITDPALFQQLATTRFGTSSARAGCFNHPPGVIVPWATNTGEPVNYMVRAWDNRGGTLITWAEIMADPSIPAGTSDIFTGTVVFAPGAPALMTGITSFNLTVVPEPSVLALGLFGGGLLALVLCSSRRATKDHG